MLNHSKTFRLFISSTFSDFQREREVLQVKVFPKIQEYCSLNGYTFQPIDLRWGVSNEAQLDQKTLEICLNEVQSCKIHDYPNFLIMLGDRYGWIPLPNTIEKNEFEILLENITDGDKKHLTHWYIEDKNQLPVSYILKQRENKYIDDGIWEVVENKIRHILQEAASKSDLDNNIKDKYFISATEAEAIEGIVPYLTTTEYQQKLLQLIPNLKQTDSTHIFGFFRHINNTTTDDKFVSTDHKKSKKFKEKIKKILPDANTLNINTSQINKNKLDESYLDQFETSIIEFLKHQIDKQISEDNKSNYLNLEIEKFQQEYFLNKKIKNFLGQEKVLTEIQNYIDNDITHPLIICGKSGIGKSSIIAKAIENTSITSSKKIIYRFIGATPYSTTTKDILTSILDELNIVVEIEKKRDKNNYILTDIDKEENIFTDFSYKVYNEIMHLSDDIVIFIDAVDQFTNHDQFLWLPNKLPQNIKIVISALKDKDYREDSKYFYTLKEKISNYIEIEPFNKPIELLELLLSHKKRTLQPEQKEYFLTQYEKVKTPLYVYIASTQIQYWTSSDIVDKNIFLSFTQKDMVKKFIENLSSIHHHDKRLVQKIFGYILSSKEGLSEYEILELLNTDKDFIKSLAPDTWHTNTTQKLPLVIWTRLYNHIKSFLSRKNQEGQELLYFFHREFIDVVENKTNQKTEHNNITKATQELIIQNQDKEFNSNRWGKIYATLLAEYFLKYEEEEKIKEYAISFSENIQTDYLEKLLDYIKSKGDFSAINNKLLVAFSYRKISNIMLNIVQNKSNNFTYKYRLSLHDTANILLKLARYENVLNIENENLTFMENSLLFKKLIEIYKLKDIFKINLLNTISPRTFNWIILFIKTRENISICHLTNDEIKKSLTIDEKNLKITNFIYLKLKDFKNWEKYYIQSINKLVLSMYQNSHRLKKHIYVDIQGKGFDSTRAISMQYKALKVIKNNSNEQTNYLLEEYSDALYNLAIIKDDNINNSIELLYKSSEIIKKLINLNPNRYYKKLLKINAKIIELSHSINSILKTENIYIENIKVLNTLGTNEIEVQIHKWSHELDVRLSYIKDEKQQLEIFLLNKKIIEFIFNLDKKYWAKTYVKRLIALGNLLSKNKIDDNQLLIVENLQKEGVDICEKFLNKEDDEWYDLYTKNMNNLANTYSYLNKRSESYALNKKNLSFSFKLFQNDQQRWFKSYYYALENMASTYTHNGQRDKEKECRKRIDALESDPLFQTIPDVMQNKSVELKIKYFDYAYKALLVLGAFFIIKYLIFE